MKHLLASISLLVLLSCGKTEEQNANQVKGNIEFHDHVFSLFTLAYDILSSVDSAENSSLIPKGLQIEWTDSVFWDGDGIEARLTFTAYDSLTEQVFYGKDGKVRQGTLLFSADNPFNLSEVRGTIQTTNSSDFFAGYQIKNMQKISGSLHFQKTPAKRWLISTQNITYKSNTGNGSLYMEKTAVFANENLSLWGNSLTITGESTGSLHGNFSSEITEPLILQFTNGCSPLYREGRKKIKLNDKEWVADFNGFNSPDCDRFVKLSLGRKEFYAEML